MNKLLTNFDKVYKNLLNVVFSSNCYTCDSELLVNEDILCVNCRHDLNLTNFHFKDKTILDEVFYGKIDVKDSTALLYFEKKSKTQQLMHLLKYKGKENIGTFLGLWLAEEIKESDKFKNIDIVVNVPLHPKKLRERGYNQTTTFAKAFSDVLEIPLQEKALVRNHYNKTQTKKGKSSRYESVENLFSINEKIDLSNKNILLVDDVITTGSTLEAIVKELKKHENCTVSIATMSYTL